MTLKLKSLEEIKDLKNKKVLLRVDFNVPLSAEKILDDTRIRLAWPTIKYLQDKGAKIILISHLGRPNFEEKDDFETIKKKNPHLSLRQVAAFLQKNFEVNLDFFDDYPIGDQRLVEKIDQSKKQIIFLENIRFYPQEENNDQKFSKNLAALAEFYVNEAFSASHRAHSSVSGVTKFLPSFAGFLLQEEIKNLSYLLGKPKKPFIVLMGGAKISDKIEVIKNLSKIANEILLGGALVNNFLKVQGFEIGGSLVEEEGMKIAKELLKNKKIVLPCDVVVGRKNGEMVQVVNLEKNKKICSSSLGIYDIGPRTILTYAEKIKKAQTLVWNGPFGLYEVKQFSHGTLALGRLFAARSRGLAFGVAGGGETIDALKKTGMIQYVDWVSSGGGAMLEFLSGKTLPGLIPLKKINN